MKKWQPIRARTSNEGWLTSYADLITNLLIFFVLIMSASQMQTGKLEKIMQSLSSGEPQTQHNLSKAEEEIKKVLTEEGIADKVSVELGDEGLELAFQSGVMFTSGSAEILPAMQEPLQKVLTAIGKYQDRYSYAVEGHTDETPMHSGHYRDNWDLSSARALQVRGQLESSGVVKNKIRVEAYADTKVLPDATLNGLDREHRLALHRRVVIRIY